MAYSSVVLADSPVAYWRLGEPSGTSAADASGNSYTGTYVGSPTLGVTGALTGDANTAATFASGSSQRVTTATLGTLGSNILTASWEFWFKSTYTTDRRCIFGTVNTGATTVAAVYSNSNNAAAYSSGLTAVQIRDNAGHEFSGSINTNIYDGNWHHVVWVMESTTTMSCYVDNVSRTITAAGTNAALSTYADFGFAMILAARNLRGAADLHMTGSLDEVAFYATRLTSTQVGNHYNAGLGLLGSYQPGFRFAFT